MIEKTVAERRPDGGWAWRVEFVDVSGEAGPVCIWIQLDDRTLGFRECLRDINNALHEGIEVEVRLGDE